MNTPHPPGLLTQRVDSYRAELLGFLRRRLPPCQAEELAQETWLRVARAAPACPNERAFRAYLYAVARRLLIDHHRRRSTRITLVDLDADVVSANSPDQQVEAGQLLTVVQRCLDQMKPELAEVFRWRMTESISFKQIAARQGIGLNTALGRHHRATKKIAEALRAAGLVGGSDEL